MSIESISAEVTKMLVFSDVEMWKVCEKLVDEFRPDIVILAGDLVWDGGLSFWLEWYGIEREEHVSGFYGFLEYAGRNSNVLVVKGNHDVDFKGDYSVERINGILGCREISGRIVEVKGLRFLGLGTDELASLRRLKPLIEKFKGKVDVAVMHGPRLQLVSQLKPKLIIRGGYGFGKHIADCVPCVFNNHGVVTTVELENGGLPKIIQYRIANRIQTFTQLTIILEEYPSVPQRNEWIKPYPETSPSDRRIIIHIPIKNPSRIGALL